MPLDVLLLGVQGSGKGTQAKRHRLGVRARAHLRPATCSAPRWRTARRSDSACSPIYDAGELVPDDLMIELIRERAPVARNAQTGFVLDGFPRTMAQADALDSMLAEIDRPLSVVFELQVPDEVAIERLRKRAAEEGRPTTRPRRSRSGSSSTTERRSRSSRTTGCAGNLVGIHGDRPENEVFAEIQEAVDQARVATP